MARERRVNTSEDLPLRITLLSPSPDVAFAVQLGRDDLLSPVRSGRDELTFEFMLRLGPPGSTGHPTLRGRAAQGPPDARFVYINSGRRAGDSASCWDRRAKVPLGAITAKLLAAWRAASGAILEAQVAGTDRHGGPLCDSVPLLAGGWRLGK